jgi:hypothetical protein
MGTGKTLMAIAIAHVFSAGRPYACLFIVPPQILLKTAREILQTIPGARTYVIDSLRSLRPGQTGPQGVNELRLRNGRIVRDGIHTTLTDMRLRGKYKSAWDRWVAELGPGPHFVICGRDRATASMVRASSLADGGTKVAATVKRSTWNSGGSGWLSGCAAAAMNFDRERSPALSP